MKEGWEQGKDLQQQPFRARAHDRARVLRLLRVLPQRHPHQTFFSFFHARAEPEVLSVVVLSDLAMEEVPVEREAGLGPTLARAVTDRGANMRKTAQLLVGGDDADACLCHLIKSGVDALLSPTHRLFCRTLLEDTSVSMALATFIRSSSVNLKTLQSHASAETAHLTISSRNDTRWEGLITNLERVLEMKEGVQGAFGDEEALSLFLRVIEVKSEDFPSDAFFDRLQFMYDMLLPLRVLSKRAQGVNAPVMLWAVTWIGETIDSFEPCVNDTPTKAAVRTSFAAMANYFLQPLITGVTTYTKAAMLSPLNYLVSRRLSQQTRDEIWGELLDDAVAYAPREESESKKLLQRKMFDLATASVRADIEAAWEKKLVGEPAFKEFWLGPRQQASGYSFDARGPLIPVLKSYMSMPLASSYAESSFSFTGALVTKKRINLTASNVEAISVIQDYMRQNEFSFESFMNDFRVLRKREHEESERRDAEETAKKKKQEVEALRQIWGQKGKDKSQDSEVGDSD